MHIPTTPKSIPVENNDIILNQISAPKLSDAPVIEKWNYQSGATTTEAVAISEDGEYTALLTNSNLTLFDKSSNIPMWTYAQLGLNSLGMSGDGKYILGSRNGFACLLNNSIESPKTEVWTRTMSAVVSTTSISESGE
ncbi:MAG TPA: hypothetical protein VGB37_12045, partial [Candidatus Lokiarchaeia archaeon]